MGNFHEVITEELRIIVCLAFADRAPSDEVAAFKKYIFNFPNVSHAIELSGTFDLMLEVSLPGVEAFQAELAARNQPLTKLISRFEASCVRRRFVRHTPAKRVIWIPCHEGIKRLDCEAIDKVIADGDYMHVYSGDQRLFVHTTMKALSGKLGLGDFIRIHRSTLVRRDFVKGVQRHENNWIACLNDGSKYQIAKSHVAASMKAIQTGPLVMS